MINQSANDSLSRLIKNLNSANCCPAFPVQAHIMLANNYESLSLSLNAGLIRTKSRIDYEKVKLIKFNVTVTDTGVPQLTSTAQINVKVININDNPPQFNETEYHLNVNENAMKRTSIGSVYAYDADEGN